MRSALGIAIVASWTTVAHSAPAQIAAPATCTSLLHDHTIVPASAVPGSAKIFASPRGFDVFWTGQDDVGSPHFAVMHRAFSPAGKPVGAATPLLQQAARHIAAGDAGTFAITYQASTPQGWQGHVTAVRPATREVLWDVSIPNEDRGHGTLAIAWDPVHVQWVVAGEQLIQLPDRAPGYVYDRLFVARIDRRGAWVEKPAYITTPGVTASLSDWGTPMIWAKDRVALVWTSIATTGQTSEGALQLTELVDGAATTIEVARGAFMRTVVAASDRGYVVAAGESGTFPVSRLFVATVRDGVAEPRQYLSQAGIHAAEPVIASDGAHVAIAWNEDEIAGGNNHRTSVRAAVLDARGHASEVFATQTPRGRHDWTQSLAPTGCGFALAYAVGINPSAIALVALSP